MGSSLWYGQSHKREGSQGRLPGVGESSSLKVPRFLMWQDDNYYYLSNTGTQHLAENDSRGLRNIVQIAQRCQSGNEFKAYFPPSLCLSFRESLPSEGHKKEAGFIENEMRKH